MEGKRFRDFLACGVAHHSIVAGAVDWKLLIEKGYKTWEWALGTTFLGQSISTPDGRHFSIRQAQISELLAAQEPTEEETGDTTPPTIH